MSKQRKERAVIWSKLEFSGANKSGVTGRWGGSFHAAVQRTLQFSRLLKQGQRIAEVLIFTKN